MIGGPFDVLCGPSWPGLPDVPMKTETGKTSKPFEELWQSLQDAAHSDWLLMNDASYQAATEPEPPAIKLSGASPLLLKLIQRAKDSQ